MFNFSNKCTYICRISKIFGQSIQLGVPFSNRLPSFVPELKNLKTLGNSADISTFSKFLSNFNKACYGINFLQGFHSGFRNCKYH